MLALRRRPLLAFAALLCFAATGCVSLTDPLGHEDDFRQLQKRFTQYVRWGKVNEAAVFVVKDQREQFLALGPDLSDIRFTDWEITRLDYESSSSARVDVMLHGYRLSAPVERVVRFAQRWEKADEGWQVRLDLAELESGLGTKQ